ncbi:hypothetical protein HN011_008019 [Eciton burchellii]|nr:hypothetical protein HN011_008019 [Eciton burchellii]
METSALNLAHERQRRAEALVREEKFEEAAKCHETAANLLAEARAKLEASLIEEHKTSLPFQETPKLLRSAHSLITLESLSLQQDYHRRQATVVRMKQAEYEEFKSDYDKRREGSTKRDKSDDRDGSLRQAIYKTIDEQDNLLSMISLPDEDDKGFKHPKDTNTVIEELRTVNSQLRSLVGSLLSQLETKEEEVRRLKERLCVASVEEIKAEEHPLRLTPLPPLTPLEMPLFDFTSS